MSRIELTEMVEIADILATSDDGVQVLFPTGKAAWLPKRSVEFWPGRVQMPVWLIKKIGADYVYHDAGKNYRSDVCLGAAAGGI